jgi:hypothetical protein
MKPHLSGGSPDHAAERLFNAFRDIYANIYAHVGMKKAPWRARIYHCLETIGFSMVVYEVNVEERRPRERLSWKDRARRGEWKDLVSYAHVKTRSFHFSGVFINNGSSSPLRLASSTASR